MKHHFWFQFTMASLTSLMLLLLATGCGGLQKDVLSLQPGSPYLILEVYDDSTAKVAVWDPEAQKLVTLDKRVDLRTAKGQTIQNTNWDRVKEKLREK